MNQETHDQKDIFGKLNKDLRFNEERWRSLINKSPDGIVVTRIDGCIEDISDRTLQMFNYKLPEEGIGKNILDFIDPSFHQKVNQKITELLDGNITGAVEFLALKKDGLNFHIEVNSDLIRSCNGEPVNFIHIIRDITKRKNAEKALHDRETELQRLYQMFRLMSDTMPDMMWAKDLNKKYIFANKAVCENLLNAVVY